MEAYTRFVTSTEVAAWCKKMLAEAFAETTDGVGG